MKEQEDLEGALEALGLELRRLPTAMPPPALVSRVRRLAHLELAERADERLSRLVLGFLILFSWTVSLFGLAAVRLLSGEGLLGSATASTPPWSVVYFVFAWISGAAALVGVGFHARKERTPA